MKKILMTLALCAAGALSAPAMAAGCETVVESNDAMQFNVKNIDVPKSCKKFSVTLKHVGKMPKTAMGHNIAISTAADMQGAITDGMAAGAAADYVKAGDARVLAHSKVIGGGETTKMDIDVTKLKAGTDYVFFCTFPGHSALMKGTLKLGS
ncbi:azurin [Comamonas sp. 26]|uniref:azurin n=1 Tax=Comamonas sp. 26 TaxID=2035201 RepID=UPI000C19A32F|nr:azurin [Comamonas sp. 26]PIF98682.1 azurin [Comamonas sp. 26]